MKGDMEVEVLTEPKDDKAAGRMKKMMMSEAERMLFCHSPNAARDNKHPGYMVDEDSGYGDTQ